MIHITHYKTPVHLSNVAKVTRTKTENVTQALWKRKKVTSVSIKWPHKDSFDQELAVWRILGFRHHLMIQTASRQSLSAFTLAYCWRISPGIEECVLLLCSRPVRRGLMATASRHGSYSVPSGYPNLTRYPVFLSIPDPTRFSFGNHQVAGNPKHQVLPDISGKPKCSGTTQYSGQ